MFTIKSNVINEFEITKSKFITFLFKVDNTKEIDKYIDDIKNKYPDATHYCYAYICDGYEKAFDDGEPSKTAGSPILNVLQKNNLDHVLCIVVRYFGGIKLGAGGLVRAYSNSCGEAIKLTKIVELVKGKRVRIIASYNDIDNLNYILKNNKVVYKEFSDSVIYEVLFDIDDIKKIEMYKYEILDDCYLEKEND